MMKFAAFALALLALDAPLASAAPQSTDSGFLYFLDDNPNGSNVWSLKVGDNGHISSPVKVPTGGKGSGIIGTDGTVTASGLHSADALVVDDDWLLTLNSGSDTISLFKISKDDPSTPVLTGGPTWTNGEFPNTVGLSAQNNLACVANSGHIPGVQCFSITRSGALKPLGDFKPLAVNQPSPPPAATGTVSDIKFNPSHTAMFVSVKGDGSDNNTAPGYIYVYPMVSGVPSERPIISRPSEVIADYAMAFVSDNRAVMADTSQGGVLLDIASDFTVTVNRQIEIPGQQATCWVTYSSEFDVAWFFDAANPNVTTINAITGDVVYVIPGPIEGGGSLDSAVRGDYLYTRTANSGVSVASLKGSNDRRKPKVPHIVQYYDATSLLPAANFNALTTWN